MQIIYKLLMSLLFASQAHAEVWYDCKTASGQPPSLTIEIKSGVWARLTVGNQKSGYLPCILKISALEQDMIKFDNSEDEYSAKSRTRECNLAYKNFGGDFSWLKIHKSMALENTAPKRGHAQTRNTSYLSNYTCTRNSAF